MKTVFVDVDTQFDFMDPEGGLCVPGAADIRPVLAELTRAAREHGVPVIATTDWHADDDREFQDFPPHCVRNTHGADKIGETCIDGAREAGLDKPLDGDAAREAVSAGAVVLRKEKLDAFSNPSMDILLRSLPGARFVVYGVATEYCVKAAVLGLLERGREVVVVEDAVRAVAEETGRAAIDDMRSKGASFRRAAQVMAEL